MKRLAFMMFFLMLGLVCVVLADEAIGVFANFNTNCIQFINPLTNEVSPPLLAGELGYAGLGLSDVAITSDGKTAVVGNFYYGEIFFIDISAGFCCEPVILGNIRLYLWVQDMAITPDDKYVLVTGKGYYSNAVSSYVAVIYITGRNLVAVNNLGSYMFADAVAITPDGQTVVVADNVSGSVHAYTLLDDGRMIHKKKVRLWPFCPTNVSISPDGKTVILPISVHSACVTLYFDDLGELHFRKIVSMPAKDGQSCVFSSDGTKAYYISHSQEKGTMVVVLNVTGPGEVSPSGTTISLPRRGFGMFFGVDTIALDPAENYLYVSNPPSWRALNGIDVIDLATSTRVDSIKGTGYPIGIAFATIAESE